MITEEQLDSLAEFGKERDGEYCDRWQFSIIASWTLFDRKYPDSGAVIDGWGFYHFNEVDGSVFFIKTLKDFDDLKNVYHAITDKELVIK